MKENVFRMKGVTTGLTGHLWENILICCCIICHVMGLWQVDQIWSIGDKEAYFFEEGAESCMCGVNPWFLG